MCLVFGCLVFGWLLYLQSFFMLTGSIKNLAEYHPSDFNYFQLHWKCVVIWNHIRSPFWRKCQLIDSCHFRLNLWRDRKLSFWLKHDDSCYYIRFNVWRQCFDQSLWKSSSCHSCWRLFNLWGLDRGRGKSVWGCTANFVNIWGRGLESPRYAYQSARVWGASTATAIR